MVQLKRILLISLFFVGSMSLFAQDIHFSQFYMSPLNLNPALTGVMNCNVRLVANYRNQWASVLKSEAYSTYSVSYDQKIPVGRYDYFGVGGTFWGDRAGSLDFKTLQGRLSFAYSKRMGGYRKKSHYLVVGADAGVSQRSIDFLAAQWGTQHDGEGGYDPNMAANENFTRDNFLFADLSAGLLWFTVLDDRNSFYIGGAFSHLNRADQSFDGSATADEVPLYSKFTLHAGGEFMGESRIGLNPNVVAFIQGPSFQLNAGTNLRFLLGKSRYDYQAFQVGAYARIANRVNGLFATDDLSTPNVDESSKDDTNIWVDAIILSTRYEYGNFTLGFSYDLNISSLRPASDGVGAFEFALLYKICNNERRGVYCPNF